jgi:hypothetical protein
LTTFTLGVVSSLVASALVLGLGALWSARVREWLLVLLTRSSNGNISRRWPDRASAEPVFVKELARAQWVNFFGGRGNEFQQDTFTRFMADRPASSQVYVRILLPDTQSNEGRYWIDRRERELAKFDKSYGESTLTSQINTSLRVLAGYVRRSTLEVRLYSGPHFGRVIITDRTLFLTGYTPDMHGRQNELAMHDSSSVVYRAMLRFFEELWERSTPYP